MKPIKVISKGSSGPLDTQTVTVGKTGSAVFNTRKAGYTSFAPTIGSISDGTSNIYGGASISDIISIEQSPDTNGAVVFELELTMVGNRSNSGWTSMVINGNTFLRTSATYNYNGTYSSWTWDGVLSLYTMWPTTGSMTPVVFN